MAEEQPPKTQQVEPPTRDRQHLTLPRIKFLEELKHRNVGRVAILYIAGGYVTLEVFDVFFHLLDMPAWAGRTVVFSVVLGFPLALIFAWAYEITPEGLKPTEEVPPQRSIRLQTGRRLDRAIIVVLAMALSYFMFDKFWLSKHVSPAPTLARAAEETETPSDATAQSTTAILTALPAVAPEKSVAVLPFLDLSEKKDQQFFSDGLTEELIDRLVKVPDLRVPARTSSFYFKGKQTTIKEIAAVLGVAHVLEGSVRKAGNTIRVTAQLIRVDNGYHLWSETYDRKVDDIFKIQDDIAGAVVDALKVSLVDGALTKASTRPNSESHTLLLQGNAISRRASGQADLETAADYYRKATQADPTYAAAWAGLSSTLSSLVANGYATVQAVSSEARAAAARAIALDPSLWQAHAAYQRIYDIFDWNFEAALKECRKRYELDPTAASNPKDLASMLFRLRGDSEEVRDLFRKALDLDPASPALFDTLSFYYYWTGRFADAESAVRKAIDLRPGRGQELLGMVLLARGEKENALIEIQREPDEQSRLDGLAYVYHAMGREKEASAALADLERLYSAESPFEMARLYAYRGELDKAFLWLDRAYVQRDDGFRYLNRDSLFANLRGDPRYAALLHKLKVPP